MAKKKRKPSAAFMKPMKTQRRSRRGDRRDKAMPRTQVTRSSGLTSSARSCGRKNRRMINADAALKGFSAQETGVDVRDDETRQQST